MILQFHHIREDGTHVRWKKGKYHILHLVPYEEARLGDAVNVQIVLPEDEE